MYTNYKYARKMIIHYSDMKCHISSNTTYLHKSVYNLFEMTKV